MPYRHNFLLNLSILKILLILTLSILKILLTLLDFINSKSLLLLLTLSILKFY